MSRLDFCINQLVDDCYDWKNDNCDECNIFKAYCEGARRAKNLIMRCKNCRHLYNKDFCSFFGSPTDAMDYCSHGERKDK